MGFTAQDVKRLREMTNVGMMDCKKALAATDGDMDKAVDYLRERGLAAAQKKASRIAAEGVVAAVVNGNVGAMIEVNSETDFVAKNEVFTTFCNDLSAVVSDENPADIDALLACKYPGSELTVQETLQEKILVIGENLKLRRFARYETGKTVAYVHMGGKIGVLVNMEVSEGLCCNEKVVELGKDLAMQIAAMNPSFLDKSNVDSSSLDKEREILMAQAKQDPKNAGKPDNIIEKMVSGRIGKYYEENCLLQQAFVKENKQSVEQHVAAVAKEVGGTIVVKAYTRYATGEGIEKQESDFAAEVASMIK